MPCGVKYIFNYINIYADFRNIYVKNTGLQQHNNQRGNYSSHCIFQEENKDIFQEENKDTDLLQSLIN